MDGREADEWPAVSYVMPVLNEQAYVASAVRSVLAQEYPGAAEIVLALGPSTDRTNDIVAELARQDERIRFVDNPRADIPIGLNLAIAAAKNPIIVRVDAHAQLPPGYTAHAVRTLHRTGAANVGGIMLARGTDGFQAAVARAYNSPLGLGGGPYHSPEGAPEGPAESAYLGVFRADALAEVGGYDESLRRGEDWELNHRLAATGHVVWLDPALQVTYWPRDNWPALARQFWATGIWRGELVRRLHVRNSPRFFAPPALVITALVALAPLRMLRRPARAGLVVYAGTLAVAARGGGSVPDRLRYALVMATMHVAWGSGFLVGVTRGARDAVDASRVAQSSQPTE